MRAKIVNSETFPKQKRVNAALRTSHQEIEDLKNKLAACRKRLLAYENSHGLLEGPI